MPQNNFKNLIFEGGGVKGVAYVGALQELEKKAILPRIKRVAGTSAGSIIALLLSLDYSVKEIKHIMATLDFKDFVDNTLGFITDTLRTVTKYGWNKGKTFYQWTGNIIAKKTGNKNITFKQLKQTFSKDLYVIGTNLSKQRTEIYSNETTPNMKVRDAVRISMSIPLFFKAVRRSKKQVLVDGGVTYNYPINIFDDEKYIENKANAQKVTYKSQEQYVFNHETLGFRLDSKDEITYNKAGWKHVPKEIDNIKDYAFALLSFMMESANKKHIHSNDWNRTVFIDTLGVKATDFSISQEKIKALIQSGRDGVNNHFTWRNGPKGMKKPS